MGFFRKVQNDVAETILRGAVLSTPVDGEPVMEGHITRCQFEGHSLGRIDTICERLAFQEGLGICAERIEYSRGLQAPLVTLRYDGQTTGFDRALGEGHPGRDHL